MNEQIITPRVLSESLTIRCITDGFDNPIWRIRALKNNNPVKQSIGKTLEEAIANMGDVWKRHDKLVDSKITKEIWTANQ